MYSASLGSERHVFPDQMFCQNESGHSTLIVFRSLAPKFACKIKWLIVNNNDLQWPGNFACKDKDVRRDRPKIAMDINAENNGRDHGEKHPCARGPNPGRAATHQTKTRCGFPHRKSGLPDLRTHEKADLGQARDRRTIPEFQFPE